MIISRFTYKIIHPAARPLSIALLACMFQVPALRTPRLEAAAIAKSLRMQALSGQPDVVNCHDNTAALELPQGACRPSLSRSGVLTTLCLTHISLSGYLFNDVRVGGKLGDAAPWLGFAQQQGLGAESLLPPSPRYFG
jgi:hypothetical protein